MKPRRDWKIGDDYWALCIRGDQQRYFPVFQGTVTRVERDTIRLSTGSWRYIDEGLPFLSQASAVAFIEQHPLDETHSLWRWADRPGAADEPYLSPGDACGTVSSGAHYVSDAGEPTAWSSARTRRSRDCISRRSAAALTVVGIGGSAGGITALRQLLPALRPGSAAFVVVMHLPLRQGDQLAAVLQRSTVLKVVSAESEMGLERDHIYTIPDTQRVAVRSGRLCFGGRSITGSGPRNIDHFFNSLAHENGQDATAVLLSGTNRDGSAGLDAVRRARGTTFVQSPESALFDTMPRSAATAAQLSLDPVTLGRLLMAVLFSRGR